MSFRINETYICSVVFMDIVGYSAIPNERQRAMKNQFNSIVAEALSVTSTDSRLSLDTGDGAAIGFLWNPEHALHFARSVNRQFIVSGVKVRVGMNLGPITIIKDINDRYNMVGDGVNAAQRIMDFAGAGQLFSSQSYYEAVRFLSGDLPALFIKRDTREDKHGRKHMLYEVKEPLKQAASSRPEELLVISEGLQSGGLLSPPRKQSQGTAQRTPGYAPVLDIANYEGPVSAPAGKQIPAGSAAIDDDIRGALKKFGPEWSETQCWPQIWAMLSDAAVLVGLDERTVRRRGKFLWDELASQQESLKLQTKQEQIKTDKLNNASQKHQAMHLKQLFEWQKKLSQGKWNYSQWDDFIDSLAQPVDIKALEKVRDSRFVFDEVTAIDKKYWFMWTRNANLSESRVSWTGAKKVVEIMNRQNHGGYDDWRLPSKVDLENMMLSAKEAGYGVKAGSTIADYFTLNGFQEFQPNEYWTSSIHAIDEKSVWFVDFIKGFTYFMSKSNVARVWAIRKIS